MESLREKGAIDRVKKAGQGVSMAGRERDAFPGVEPGSAPCPSPSLPLSVVEVTPFVCVII